MIASARYINDGEYIGGFTEGDIEELLGSLSDNYLGWSEAMAPLITGNREHPGLGAELTKSFCQMEPKIAETFARVTFLSDNRADLLKVEARTLVLQCKNDIIADERVGAYVADHIKNSTLAFLDANGHCPNLSAPQTVIAANKEFI